MTTAISTTKLASEHYGPTGDAARHIASYCGGDARRHVYLAAFNTFAALQAENARLREHLASYNNCLVWLRTRVSEVEDNNRYWGGPHKDVHLLAPEILKEFEARIALSKETQDD